MNILNNTSEGMIKVTVTRNWYATLRFAKMHPRTKFVIPISNNTRDTVSHFSYAPLIKCKITQKRKMIFLFWDCQRKAHLYLHYPLQFHCDQIRNDWENRSWRALPSKHHFTLHYFEWNSVHTALFSGSYFCFTRDKSRFILGNI